MADATESELDWPPGFERTPPEEREPYPHGFRVTRAEAFDSILAELELMDAVNIRIETAAPHTQTHPHRPYADRDPADPGVVVYCDLDGQGVAFPCDRWASLRDNARAIAKYLDAKRALDRYGVQTVGSEFETQALPEPDEAVATGPPPHEVLGVAPDAPEAVVRGAARARKKETHPDNGGSTEAFQRVIAAEEAMCDE
ncbi:J domain-containing protein [Haloglomus litoreum]|uniref:J domain-containing protein n=1 Tax=Haloglomus litoreum TaxID=3034026 RepID=UPI0023E8E1FF|nr:J domain-containing protein [Haloglomus sp. DT116]